MFFEGTCIDGEVTETEWYVAVLQAAQPGEYWVVSKPLGRQRGVFGLQGAE